MKSTKELTRRKIEHLLDWARALKVKYVWNADDQTLEDYLKELRKKILRRRYEKL